MLTAHLSLNPAFAVGRVRRRLFGSFVEHLGRGVYTGIYEPGHPTADAEGFRRDVVDLVRELGVTTIRYPGGNFVSGYRWEDGVGPAEERPRRLDLAWHSTETNEIGLHEFASWLERIDGELMYAVNLGTRGVQEALDVLEYTTLPGGTALSDARVRNGRPEPFDISIWCLGNEMDGPWQLGHLSAEDYAKLAQRTASAMRQLNPDLELVVCGSSSADMPTFGSWERTVLEHCYDEVDLISCHAYYELRGGDLGSFLASAVDMDRFIDSVVATADHVKGVRGSDKSIDLSFDEWNVWYIDRYHDEDRIRDLESWPTAPRLLEDAYSVADAVVFGNLLISLLNHADRVASASLAQLVNVIAPIMTEPGGPSWRQTTFFPFATTARLARGTSLAVTVDVPGYETAAYGTVPLVDVAATYDETDGAVAMFLVNRSQTEEIEVHVDLSGVAPEQVLEALSLHDDDLSATNTLAQPERVGLRDNTTAKLASDGLRITLPPVSWTALSAR